MGNKAVCTVLDALFRIAEVAAALITQRIQGAVAEQAVKILVRLFVARKEFALPVLKEGMVITSQNFHHFPIKSFSSSQWTAGAASVTSKV